MGVPTYVHIAIYIVVAMHSKQVLHPFETAACDAYMIPTYSAHTYDFSYDVYHIYANDVLYLSYRMLHKRKKQSHMGKLLFPSKTYLLTFQLQKLNY